MTMLRPTESHEKLKALAGVWMGEERIHPSPYDPAGGRAVGRALNRLALDGFALIHEDAQDRNGDVTFTGHGVFTWDREEQRNVLYWSDSCGAPPNIFTGRFECEVLILVNRTLRGWFRAVWDLSVRETYSYRMEVSPDGASWMTFVEGVYALRLV